MAIADTITSMQTHTSNAYTMIGYGTDLTGINKNLENLSTSIKEAFLEALRNPDTLFTNLPKKSGTGANITLNDTANAPMRIELGASELSQDGTPTPSSPQDIHTISGSNKVVVCGKNLFDKATTTTGKLVSRDDGTLANNASYQASDYIAVEQGESYTISNFNRWYSAYYDSNKNYVTYPANADTITIPNGVKYIRLSCENTNINIAQFEKGETATTYEPYVSQEADIDLGYENLWNENTQVFINQSRFGITVKDNNNVWLFKITASDGYAFATSTIILPAGTYTASANANNGSYALFNGATQLSTTFTLTEQATITFRVFKNGVIGDVVTLSNIMIEKGSVAHNYTPYGKAINYCKIGNYEDKFIRNSGKNLVDFGTQSFTTYKDYTGLNIPAGTYNFSTKITSSDTTYTASRVYIYGANGGTEQTFINLNRNSRVNASFTTTFDIVRIVLYSSIDYSSSNGKTATYEDIMLNKGTTALPYEPYGSNEWYIKKNIGKVVLDGTENWSYYTSSGKPVLYLVTNDAPNYGKEINYKKETDLICYCDNYLGKGETSSFDDIYDYGNNVISFRTTYDRLVVRDDTMTSEVDFKTWLTSHNTTLYYVMATPTYTKITGTLAEQLEYIREKMMSQNGQTNISQLSNDLAFNLNVSAIEE